ncbi:hypothetical protein INS49_010614 [Diaporthe citri]|uniref:uncharacterized protein n=1 Tax=Diaporthe citri TaxID=83186 RepID=UPI001C821A1B|nr:uncharacterized protein INS49_010614 [Diaporthe citri]KAG6362384.1 hypothetical protein INS49_010614 [Diaporthe citri]
MSVYSRQGTMPANDQFSMLSNGQASTLQNDRPDESRRRICGGLVQHPYDWRFRTGATISQAVAIFICAMLMASLVFHWGVDKDALFNSPMMTVGWTATVLLLWNFVISIMQERYDFFTRSKDSHMYRSRQRLFVWELAHALFSTGILAGWSVLLRKAQCLDNRRPGCTIGIAASAMLGGFASAQWGFVLFIGCKVYKLNHEEHEMLDVVQHRHGGQPVQRTVSNMHDRGHKQPKNKMPADAYSRAAAIDMQRQRRGGAPPDLVPPGSYGPQNPDVAPQFAPLVPQPSVNGSQYPTSNNGTHAPGNVQQKPPRR